MPKEYKGEPYQPKKPEEVLIRDVKGAELNRDIKAGIKWHNRRVEAEKKEARRRKWKLAGEKQY